MPGTLVAFFGVRGLVSSMDPYSGFENKEAIRGIIATVLEDPGINPSDVEIHRTGPLELVIRGTGFNDMVKPVMDFDPPLDSSNLDIEVSTDEKGCVMSVNSNIFRAAFVVLFDCDHP